MKNTIDLIKFYCYWPYKRFISVINEKCVATLFDKNIVICYYNENIDTTTKIT